MPSTPKGSMSLNAKAAAIPKPVGITKWKNKEHFCVLTGSGIHRSAPIAQAFAISSFLSLILTRSNMLSLSQSSSFTNSEGRLRRYLKIGCPSYSYAFCFWSLTFFSMMLTLGMGSYNRLVGSCHPLRFDSLENSRVLDSTRRHKLYILE